MNLLLVVFTNLGLKKEREDFLNIRKEASHLILSQKCTVSYKNLYRYIIPIEVYKILGELQSKEVLCLIL